MLFAADPVYRQFLAIHAGLWGEVGVLENARLLAVLRRARRKAGLPPDRYTSPDPSRRASANANANAILPARRAATAKSPPVARARQ